MNTNKFLITKYHAVQKKYSKLKQRYTKKLLHSSASTTEMHSIQSRLDKYRRQLQELAVVLQRAGKKGLIAGSLALGLTFTACDDDTENLFPDAVDFSEIVLNSTTTSAVSSIDIGSRSTPEFVDIDGDGDLDLFVGANHGVILYYKNTGSATSPTFTAQSVANNPLGNVQIESRTRISFGDIDGDGDFDAILGNSKGVLRYYKNTGSASSPSFTEQIGTNNIFSDFVINTGNVSEYNIHPVLVDFDNDGDLDVMMASEQYSYSYANSSSYYEYTQQIRYFKNTGSKTNPSFTEQTGSSNPVSGLEVNYAPKIVFADLDRDGDLDLILGDAYSIWFLKVYENTGSRSSASFVERTSSTDNPLSGMTVPSYPFPALADVDGDGDLDFFLGQNDGTIDFYKNETGE